MLSNVGTAIEHQDFISSVRTVADHQQGGEVGVRLRGWLVVELELAAHVIFPVKSLLKWVYSVFWNTPAM
jgi:hypothetical protein